MAQCTYTFHSSVPLQVSGTVLSLSWQVTRHSFKRVSRCRIKLLALSVFRDEEVQCTIEDTET
jgi:hypothetical protein